MSLEVRAAVLAARRYDEATEEFHGFTASRRNYDVAQGIGADGRPQSGVLEPSWRVGGASSAELAALAAFARDSSLKIVRASHVEEYGEARRAPADTLVDFQGDDPEAGPLLRYTIVTPQDQQLRQKICGRCVGAWRGLPAPVISSDACCCFESGLDIAKPVFLSPRHRRARWSLQSELSRIKDRFGRPRSLIIAMI